MALPFPRGLDSADVIDGISVTEAINHARADRWQRVDALFAAALEEESSRRDTFLQHACSGAEGLLAAVRALLRASDAARSFMGTQRIARQHDDVRTLATPSVPI